MDRTKYSGAIGGTLRATAYVEDWKIKGVEVISEKPLK
ncbi:hypothetical protein X560_2447 [Listeria fleischmannii 1991]|uniref:Uncharacterized protein n=1 Tax=Listeria fleischmannii 1991 TaxID=1430899 RepID=A0A0J8J152_9LIST|nr:hypothetical protein X560_2447 [Listeria fleischmannii 1991]